MSQVPRTAPEGGPLVSALIRSIGRPELREALASVAAQTYPRIEVIVVDALGQAHPPLEPTCGSFPLRTVSSGVPLARSPAANTGLAQSRGEFLIFLDDDDWWQPAHVAALAAVLAQTPDVGLAYAGARAVNESGDVVLVLNQPFSEARLRAGNFIPLHAALFRRSLVEQGCRFDEAFDVYEDWDFLLQLAERTTFVHVDQISASYRVGGGSGVGPRADAERSRRGRACVLDKWRRLWSGRKLDDTLESLNEEIRDRERGLGQRDQELARRDRELARQAADFVKLERHIAELLGSRSWRYTAPLRRLSAWWRRNS